MIILEDRLSETEKVLRRRDRELETLLAKVNALTERPVEAPPGSMQEQTKLREELRKTTDLLQVKDSAIQQLKKDLIEKLGTLGTQLTAQEKLVQQRDKELQALRAQLTETGMAKNEAESLLAEELRREKQALTVKDAAIKDLEKNLTVKVRNLESEMREKQALLDSRSSELESLKSEVNVFHGQLADVVSAKERAEKMLQQEFQKKTEMLQSKDAAFKELQESSRAKFYALESQIAEKEKLQKQRDKELEALRAQLTETGTAKNEAESFLAEELRREKQALTAKDAAIKDLEKNLTAKIRALEAQVAEKQEILQTRSTELEAFRSEVNVLHGQLADVVSAKERAENMLQQELKKKTALLQSKDAALRELETRMTAKVQDLENQQHEKGALLQDRHAELASLRTQLNKIESAKEEMESLLRDELGKTTEVLQAKDSTIKELQDSLKKTIDAFNNRVSEQQTLLTNRDEELETLRSEITRLNAQLVKTDSVVDWTMRLLDEPPQDSMTKRLEESFIRIQALESTLREKEDLLKSHDEKAHRLESELKEKRTELAKHEIAVWQTYERRTLWRQRLAKFCILVKERGAW